jgi:predicted DNA-binding protein
MVTVAFKMDRKHVALLRQRAKVLGRSQAVIVRDLIEEHFGQNKRSSLYERAKDLCGSVRSTKDLSIRPLTGYGHK